MILRRLAPLALCAMPLLAAADDPPWVKPAPPAGAAPAAATGPAAAAPAGDDPIAVFGELLAPVLSPEAQKKFSGAKRDDRNALLTAEWQKLMPHQQAQIRFAMEHLAEGGRVATQRSVALLILGPPLATHSETAREFTGEMAERIDDLAVLARRLRGEPAAAAAPMLTLSGSHPAETWVYPADSLNELRVLVFVDEDGDGSFRFVRDQTLPAGTRVSAAPPVELPTELFPPASAGQPIEKLPELVTSGLQVKTRADFFKASAGRTFARFTLIVDPRAVDFDLGLDPAAFGATAMAWVRVEQAGAPVWQGKVSLTDSGATRSAPWMTELSVPLVPGSYSVTAQIANDKFAGGRASMDVTVPAFTGEVALSSVIMSVTGAAGPERVPDVDDADLLPFQVGNYLVVPSPTGQFQRGQSVAFVAQVYGSQSATIEYDLYADGVYQSSLEPGKVSSLPSTQIMILDLTDKFRDGTYELRITVKNPAKPTETSKISVPFGVRG